jgi:hypothetical protein
MEEGECGGDDEEGEKEGADRIGHVPVEEVDKEGGG